MTRSIPLRLPAVAQDRMIYGCRFGRHEYGNFVLRFGGCLDERRLEAALRLAMDAEPVFGCRYVPGRKPYWERRADLDSLTLCTVTQTADFARELERFVAAPRDGTRDPLLSARIVRADTDVLLLKTSHLPADGVGGKQLLSLIASLYRDPNQDGRGVVPNLGSRGAGLLFREIGWRECLRILRQPSRRMVTDRWPFPMANDADQGTLRFAIRRLEPHAFEALSAFGKRFGARLNDVFVAACFRSLWRFLNFPAGVPQTVMTPTDVRRYLQAGATEAIANFIAPLHATMVRVAGEPFAETLVRVNNLLAEPVRRNRAVAAMFWISLLYGLFHGGTARAIEKNARRSAEMRRVVFTNLGAFEPDQFDFGVPFVDIYRISHAGFAPGLVMNVSSFRKRLTFAINYPSRAIRPEDIERFLDTFIEELLHTIPEEPVSASAVATLSPATPETGHPVAHLPNTR